MMKLKKLFILLILTVSMAPVGLFAAGNNRQKLDVIFPFFRALDADYTYAKRIPVGKSITKSLQVTRGQNFFHKLLEQLHERNRKLFNTAFKSFRNAYYNPRYRKSLHRSYIKFKGVAKDLFLLKPACEACFLMPGESFSWLRYKVHVVKCKIQESEDCVYQSIKNGFALIEELKRSNRILSVANLYSPEYNRLWNIWSNYVGKRVQLTTPECNKLLQGLKSGRLLQPRFARKGLAQYIIKPRLYMNFWGNISATGLASDRITLKDMRTKIRNKQDLITGIQMTIHGPKTKKQNKMLVPVWEHAIMVVVHQKNGELNFYVTDSLQEGLATDAYKQIRRNKIGLLIRLLTRDF